LRKATRNFDELESGEFPEGASAEEDIEAGVEEAGEGSHTESTEVEAQREERREIGRSATRAPIDPNDAEAPLEPFDNATEDVPHVEPEAVEGGYAEGARAKAQKKSAEKWSNVPDLILIDGGKGQLNAALAELEKLGLSNIPVIGLAKEFEEIYRPGESEPLRLDHNTGALKLLQRVRDESHRFANTYNAKLRLKKISESILDEFPGIGERRKSALLKKFGSVQRMRTATLEQIAEVPGFGGKAAAELKAFLDARPGS
jgi:excinuclease ABC subunit C